MYTITELPSMGYGNPDASISYKKQMQSGELTETVATKAAHIILSGDAMTAIDNNDDGCIDGRPAIEVLYASGNGKFATKHTVRGQVHQRAKVAGGGYMTTLAMQVASGLTGNALNTDLSKVAHVLSGQGVYCGAHSGGHAVGSTTDCGANDKFQVILQNGITHKVGISKHVAALLQVAGIQFDENIMSSVFAGWKNTLANEDYFLDSTGVSRFAIIKDAMTEGQKKSESIQPVAVSKHLDGDHKEDFIVINYVESKSFSQQLFADLMAKEFPDIPAQNRAQVFVVDVPRIVLLAASISPSLAQESNEDALLSQSKALYAGIAYQLATAATLTDGTLPIYIVKQ